MRNEEEKKRRKEKNLILDKEYEEYYLKNQTIINICKKCKNQKPLSRFISNRNFKNICKICHGKKIKSWRNENPEIEKSIRKKYFKRSAEYIKSFKENKSCSFCMIPYPPHVLDFHHIEEKISSISKLYGKKQEKVDAEIKKCILLCANCHRNETHDNEHTIPTLKNRNFFPKIMDIGITEGCETKKCMKCEILKNTENFTLLKTRKTHSYCKKCMRKVNHEANQKRTDKRLARKNIISIKDNQKCADCKHVFRYWMLDFDHIKGEKIGNINILHNGSVEKVLEETSKCELVCVNCHRIRTFLKKNHLGQQEVGQQEVFESLKSLGMNISLNHKINGCVYDIYLPDSNLLIEFYGFKYHSLTHSRKRDLIKYKSAISSNFQYLAIFEDEWKNKKDFVISLILNKINFKKPSFNLRPKQCEIKLINFKEADEFYNTNHYIGACKPRISYGVFFENKLISCSSFKHPTRQSSHDWELVRMVADPEYRVHGIWSKILKQFISEYSPKSIVSFSDNRLFEGNVYSKIGFKHDGEIPPDYYWIKENKRFHKSGLRKKKLEKETNLTEYQLREAQGFIRIWDLGKKRWVLENRY
jgi:cytochrome c553